MKKYLSDIFNCLPALLLPVILSISLTLGGQPLFKEINPQQSHITFQNTLKETPQSNIITYEYFYNGGGVAAGDFNNDGLIDLYFTANTENNKLYLNKGDFVFEDITRSAGVGGRKGWKTGVTVADVNGDGWLDIYVCYSGDVEHKHRKNQLFINNGNLTFTDRAAEYGIDDPGHSTHAAFFDFDQDGDLDLYVLNHNVKQFKNFDAAFVKGMIDPDAGDRLYENRNGKFVDITIIAGIKSNPLGYGLGISIADINNDGWPDIYICNDYVEEDYLYLNNHDGTFTEVLKETLKYISNFSMGIDIGDINNDGWPDILTLDMLPADNKRQKLLFAPDNFEMYNNMVDNGFHHQYMRNMLHLNNRNGTFSEIGQLAGISNTDWSWSALIADYDNDGWSDLFITNGYGRDMINRDFMKFYANERLKHLQGKTDDKMFQMLQSITATPLRNYLFKNNGDLSFTDMSASWGIDMEDFAHGAIYADLDNDGALDLVFNRINDYPGVYRNQSPQLTPSRNWIQFSMSNHTDFGIGTRITLHTTTGTKMKEYYPVHGFQSAMAVPLHFGLGQSVIDSVTIRSGTGAYYRIRKAIPYNQLHQLADLAKDAYTIIPDDALAPPPITIFNYPPDSLPTRHQEVLVNDFKVQPLIPNMVSFHGPKTAVGDIDGDGLEDIYLCNAEGSAGVLLRQKKDGSFTALRQAALLMDTKYEDADAVFFDADGDGDLDLFVVSGGFGSSDSGLPLEDRLYINHNGAFMRKYDLLPTYSFSGSVAVAWDYDQDGDMDLFVGGRVSQGEYPNSPGSILLNNDGRGNFTLSSSEEIALLRDLGMVTHAILADLNGDGHPSLVVCGEWMNIRVFEYDGTKIIDNTSHCLSDSPHGWWNKLLAYDLDGDGDLDLVGGNWGLNSQFKASREQPVSLYYDDFDDNGYLDPIMCYYIDDVSYPMTSRDELTDQIVSLRKQYVTYDSFSEVRMEDIFGEEKVKNSPVLIADNLATMWFENINGKLHPRSFPIEANFSPVHAILAGDFDHDGITDILLMGNIEYARIKIGKSHANYSCLLRGLGDGQYEYVPQLAAGLNIHGSVRSLEYVDTPEGKKIIVGINDASPLLLEYGHKE